MLTPIVICCVPIPKLRQRRVNRGIIGVCRQHERADLGAQKMVGTTRAQLRQLICFGAGEELEDRFTRIEVRNQTLPLVGDLAA